MTESNQKAEARAKQYLESKVPIPLEDKCPACDGSRKHQSESDCIYDLQSQIASQAEELRQLRGGDYYHDVHCSALRNKPMGDGGCSCSMFQRAEKAEAELSRLQWQPITPENLPSIGDEMLTQHSDGVWWVHPFQENPHAEYGKYGLTVHPFRYSHFRPITPPTESEEAK